MFWELKSVTNFMARLLDESKPPVVIAEVADAHYGDMERAIQMIHCSKSAGADIVKFQHHLPDEEMLPDIPTSSNMQEPLYEFLKRNALTIHQHVVLARVCEEVGITYLCTPFSLKAAQELEEAIDPPAYKIGSGELTDIPTLLEIALLEKPMILSTGMATVAEIEATYAALSERVRGLVLLNCTSAYPPRLGDIRLGFISRLRDLFPSAVIGHSDHSPSIATSIASVAFGARVIEKHVTADASLQGPDQNVSISFDELRELVAGVEVVHASLGDEKDVLGSEQEIRAWARRSLVYLVDVPAGQSLQSDWIWGKRPGTGVPSNRRDDFIGRVLKRHVRANTLLHRSDFE